MWDGLGILIIVGMIGLFFLTFVMKEGTKTGDTFYRWLGRIGGTIFAIVALVTFVSMCAESQSNRQDPIFERQYPR